MDLALRPNLRLTRKLIFHEAIHPVDAALNPTGLLHRFQSSAMAEECSLIQSIAVFLVWSE